MKTLLTCLGGCASLVGAGASILSLASDIGGSTRIPGKITIIFENE